MNPAPIAQCYLPAGNIYHRIRRRQRCTVHFNILQCQISARHLKICRSTPPYKLSAALYDHITANGKLSRHRYRHSRKNRIGSGCQRLRIPFLIGGYLSRDCRNGCRHYHAVFREPSCKLHPCRQPCPFFFGNLRLLFFRQCLIFFPDGKRLACIFIQLFFPLRIALHIRFHIRLCGKVFLQIR